jgi:septal ring factor EnvC (AmiA/AmiB activator)
VSAKLASIVVYGASKTFSLFVSVTDSHIANLTTLDERHESELANLRAEYAAASAGLRQAKADCAKMQLEIANAEKKADEAREAAATAGAAAGK